MAMTDGASSIDHDPVAEEAAYAALGRLLVTLAMVDQTVIRALWHRDKTSPFPPAVPATFPAGGWTGAQAFEIGGRTTWA